MDTTDKQPVTIRLSLVAMLLADAMSKALGISRNDVFEQAIRLWARRESVTVSDEMIANFRSVQSPSPSGEKGSPNAPATYIEKGHLDVKDDVAFRTSAEAASCFGKTYRGLQHGAVRHRKEAGKIIWFPKLYRNGEWNNRLSDDENTIVEINESPEKAKEHIDRVLSEGVDRRIVFGRVQNPTDGKPYRFKGEYELDRQATNYQDGLVWRRVAERVKTYPPE